MAIDPKKLDEVIEKAGLGERTAKKLRNANKEEPKEQTPKRGGAPSPLIGKAFGRDF